MQGRSFTSVSPSPNELSLGGDVNGGSIPLTRSFTYEKEAAKTPLNVKSEREVRKRALIFGLVRQCSVKLDWHSSPPNPSGLGYKKGDQGNSCDPPPGPPKQFRYDRRHRRSHKRCEHDVFQPLKERDAGIVLRKDESVMSGMIWLRWRWYVDHR